MSDFKKPLYQLVQFDSRNAQDIGNKIGGKVGDFIENEGKQNTQNPGRGVTKAAEAIASWYLGGAAAGALGAGGGAAADALGTGAGEAGTSAAEQAALAQAATQAASTIGGGAGSVSPEMQAYLASQSTMIPGYVAPEAGTLAQAGGSNIGGLLSKFVSPTSPIAKLQAQFGLDNAATRVVPYAPGMAAQGQAESSLLGSGITPSSPAWQALTGSGKSGASRLALQSAQGLLQPPQRPPMPAPRPPMQQQIAPMQLPYQQNTNSLSGLPPPGMSAAEWLRRKQMLGY